MALSEFEATESPLSYTADTLSPFSYNYDPSQFDDDVYFADRPSNISFGLPASQVSKVCRRAFTYDIAKLTIQVNIAITF